MLNRTKYIVAILLLASMPLFAFMSSSDIGTTSGQFLKLGAGARAEGMGEAFLVTADDSSAVYWNPAGIAGIKDIEASFTHTLWLEGISYEWVGGVLGLGKSGSIGIGLQYVGYGNIVETDINGLDTGVFAPGDMALILSYGGKMGNLSYGVSGKYISMTIKQSTSSFSFDAGLKAKLGAIEAALAVENIGGSVKYITETDNLPMIVKAGGAIKLGNNLKAEADAVVPSDGSVYGCIGAEYTGEIDKEIGYALRGGFNMKTLDTLGAMSCVSVGIGIKYLDYSVDYAYRPYGDLGTTHMIGISARFPVAKEEEKKVFKFKLTAPAKPVEEVKKEEKVVEQPKVEATPIPVPEVKQEEPKKVVKRVVRRVVKKKTDTTPEANQVTK